jgi:hypothetical protein
MSEERIPTSEKLARALEAAGAPAAMATAARAGCYDDYKSDSATPCVDLVNDLARLMSTPRYAINEAIRELFGRARNGEFDAQKWESDAWAESMKDDPEMGPMLRAMGLDNRRHS